MVCEVVQVINLWFRYAGCSDYVLRGLSLRVRRGEVVILTGPTGSGKTTLCRVLTGLVPRLYRGEMRGHVRVAGVDPLRAVKAGRVMYVGPNPEEQFLFLTVEEELRSYGVSGSQIETVLGSLGLRAMRGSAVFKLSMGEKQRVALAAAFARRPDLIILDEALRFVDEPYLSRAINHVVDLSSEGSAVLVVTKAPHVISRLSPIGARLVLIDGGVVKAAGYARDLLLPGHGDTHPFLKGLRRQVTLNRNGAWVMV